LALLAARRFLSSSATTFLRSTIAVDFTVRESLRLTRSIGAYVNGIVPAEVAPSPSPQASRRDGAFEYGLACILDAAERRRSSKRRAKP